MKPVIDHYSFGRMTVNGRNYHSDLIIHADGRIQDKWRRRRGHDLIPEDIGPLLDAAPRRLIIGTGHDGRMSVAARVVNLCKERGITIEALLTADAVRQFNEAVENEMSVAACFHLTC
jgi:hypothetical protein